MLWALRKTGVRTGRFFGSALAWRPQDREYALVAWGLVAGAIWLAADTGSSWERAASGLYLWLLLAAICAIDGRYGIIPNAIVLALAIGGVALSAWSDMAALGSCLLGAVLILAAASLFRAAYRAVRGFDGVGLGDVKFLGASALWIGASGIPLLLLAAVTSAAVSLVILRLQGEELRGQQAISFGPHLALGLWLVWDTGLLQ